MNCEVMAASGGKVPEVASVKAALCSAVTFADALLARCVRKLADDRVR